MTWVFAGILGSVILALIIIVVVFRGARRKLSSAQSAQLQKEWAHVLTLTDPTRRVMEAEKVLDHAFKLMGFPGSFADKLKKAERLLSNYQPVWDAHKLRNRIAHEPGFSVSEQESGYAVRQFGKALESLQ